MDEIIDFESVNSQDKTTPENKIVEKPAMGENYIIFARVDMKTDEVYWMDNVKPIIEPLQYKNELNKDVLEDFVKSLSYAFLDKEFPRINFSDNMLYTFKKDIMEDFMKRFRWYFEQDYPYRKPLTQERKVFYQSLLLTADDKCNEIKQFGEELLGHTVNIIFFDNCYWMVGTEDNEIMGSRFWKLGTTQKEAKEHLVETYLYRKYAYKSLPHEYANGLNEVCYHYNLFSGAVRSLSKKLKLDYKEMDDFYNEFHNDLRFDGGINTDFVLMGYLTHKMVKQGLKKYKSSGEISK